MGLASEWGLTPESATTVTTSLSKGHFKALMHAEDSGVRLAKLQFADRAALYQANHNFTSQTPFRKPSLFGHAHGHEFSFFRGNYCPYTNNQWPKFQWPFSKKPK